MGEFCPQNVEEIAKGRETPEREESVPVAHLGREHMISNRHSLKSNALVTG